MRCAMYKGSLIAVCFLANYDTWPQARHHPSCHLEAFTQYQDRIESVEDLLAGLVDGAGNGVPQAGEGHQVLDHGQRSMAVQTCNQELMLADSMHLSSATAAAGPPWFPKSLNARSWLACECGNNGGTANCGS